MTTVSHSSLATHSAPFSLSGATIATSLSGTIADGIDPPELQQLVNGNWRSCDPPLRFLHGEAGGTKRATLSSAATAFRWSVPFSGHSVTTTVTSS